MAHYNAPTPKRHIAFSNSGEIARLNRGPLSLKLWKAANPNQPQTVRHSTTSGGKKKTYQGTHNLKATECRFCIYIYLCFSRLSFW